MVQSEGNMSLKKPVAPPGIDPGIVRIKIQRLNHNATPGVGMYDQTVFQFDILSKTKAILPQIHSIGTVTAVAPPSL